MANIKSAKKRIEVSARNAERNKASVQALRLQLRKYMQLSMLTIRKQQRQH